MPCVVATILTTRRGVIDWADSEAAQLLNVSVRSCHGRDLIMAFAQDRLSAIAAMRAAVDGAVMEGEGVIRPQERRPRPVNFTVTLDSADARFLKWCSAYLKAC
jgi:hypothetical protein